MNLNAVVSVSMKGAPKSGALCARCWSAAKAADRDGLLTFVGIRRHRQECVLCRDRRLSRIPQESVECRADEESS